MALVHFVTHNFPPTPGGGEQWALRFVKFLIEIGHRVVVYIDDDESERAQQYACVAQAEGFELKMMGLNRAGLEEPLVRSSWGSNALESERSRLNFLFLRNSLRRAQARYPDHKHVLISWYIIEQSYLCALLSVETGIRHLPIVVGTDFSRGVRNERERARAEFVVKSAHHVMTMNSEQEMALRAHFGISRLSTIHISVPQDEWVWRPRRNKRLTIFSDTGFAFRKGTHVLMNAVRVLLSEGLAIELVICGKTETGQREYWEEARKNLSTTCTGWVHFLGHQEQSLVKALLQNADIYASATFGEGCSHARVSALCTGIPIVTTRCGEMIDVANDISHVRIADPADTADFEAVLRRACLDVLSGDIVIDNDAIARWRDHFSENRERSDYMSLVEDLAS